MGRPINSTEWPKKSFYPVLRRLGIRVRKFYSTRHTFISVMLTEGANPAWIAQYCGTSLAMIQRSYGRYISREGIDPVALEAVRRAKAPPQTGTSTGTFPGPPRRLQESRGFRRS